MPVPSSKLKLPEEGKFFWDFHATKHALWVRLWQRGGPGFSSSNLASAADLLGRQGFPILSDFLKAVAKEIRHTEADDEVPF